MLPSSNVIFLNQISSLPTIETSNNIQSLIVESNSRVEVPSSVQACYLSPCVGGNIVNLAFVHWFTGQGTTNRVYLGTTSASQNWCQSVSPSFKDHVPSLLKSFINKLITWFSRFTRLSSSRKEDSSFFILNRHEVRRYLNVDDVGSVWVSREVVHEEIVRIVHKEMKRVNHFSIVANKRHFNSLFNNFGDISLSLRLFLQQLNLHLLLTFFQQELCFP